MVVPLIRVIRCLSSATQGISQLCEDTLQEHERMSDPFDTGDRTGIRKMPTGIPAVLGRPGIFVAFEENSHWLGS